MALFAFFLSAAVGGSAVVVLRERPKPAAAVGLAATVVCLLATIAMPDGDTLQVGAATLAADAYARLFLVAATLALLVSQLVGLAHGWQRDLPLATLGGLGLVGIGLTAGTAAAAMLTVAAAGTFVVIASLERAISMPAVRAVASGFRLAVVAGFLGLVAMAITGDDPIFVAPDVLSGAILLMASAVALRLGVIPFHAPTARLIERARTAALPLLAAWVPAAFAVVALGWTATLVALGATTPVVVVVMAFGVLTISLASAVVLIDDDLVRWLGYGVIADGGFVLLALAGDSPAAISAGLAWLICFALARSILACVLLGFQGAFDARRTRELEGWLRRTPLLGVALLAALVVGFGVPGTLSWQVRMDLAQGSLGELFGTALVAVALLPLVPIARLAWVGVRPLGDLVAAGRSERFTMPPRSAPIPDSTPTAQRGSLTAQGSSLTAQGSSLTAEGPDTTGTTGVVPGPEPEAVSASDAAPSEPEPDEARAPLMTPGADAGRTTPEAPAPTTTLSGKGRATRAARKATGPTIADPRVTDDAGGPVGPVPADEAGGPGGAGTADDAGPDAGGPGTPPGRSRREGALSGLRHAGASVSASAGPLRHGLRDLPAVWALDRTLIASLATLLLAIVGVAFATDLVGLGVAAGLGAPTSPAP